MEDRRADSLGYVCVGCGAPMMETGCKIRCCVCGYFEDCAGGLTPPPIASARPALPERSHGGIASRKPVISAWDR